MELTVSVTEVKISPENVYKMEVQFNTPDDGEELLSQFTPEKIVSTVGKDELLDEIGEEYVKEYFGLKSEE
jgi:hypothetical protein